MAGHTPGPWESNPGICPRCQQKKSTIEEQYSYGVYAGVMCRDCAIVGFNDCCGYRPEGQGHPTDLDEPYDEDGW